MPPFGGTAAGHGVETKKRSTEEVATGIFNALLILVIVVFTVGMLWLGVFAIPSFFAFFRASVVTICSIREVRRGPLGPMLLRVSAFVFASAPSLVAGCERRHTAVVRNRKRNIARVFCPTASPPLRRRLKKLPGNG